MKKIILLLLIISTFDITYAEDDYDNDWIIDSIDVCTNTPTLFSEYVEESWNFIWCEKWCIEVSNNRCSKTINDEDDEDDEWFNNLSQSTNQWDNLEWLTKKGQTWWRNTPLKDMIEDDTDFFKTSIWWTQWAYNMSIKIAYSLKNLFLILASIYLIILVFKVFFTSWSDEEIGKFKKWIVWTTVWIIVMQTAYAFTVALYDKNVTEWLAYEFWTKIIQPFIDLTLMFVSFAFLWVAIYSFYKIITAGWDEEWIKKWKQTIVQAIIWFVVIKFTTYIVESTYWKIECTSWWDNGAFIQTTWKNCIQEAELEGNMEIVVQIINWSNSLLAIVITILIIYAWVNIMLSWWDEEKMKKAKQSIIYIAIWLVIISFSYLILSFFIIPEAQF